MTDDRSNFTWVETYKEIVSYLKDKKDDQKSLINLLKDIGITGFKDQDKNGKTIELSEIDPFTFFCYLNKYGPKKRIELLQKLAKKLSFKNTSTDDSGIPSVNALKLHLFPFKSQSNNTEISTLWELFFKALEDKIDNDLFDRALKIKSVGKIKLSEALFNIDPERYFPLNGPTKPYIKEHFQIKSNFDTFTEYQAILDKLRGKTDKPFYEISFDSWNWKQQSTDSNYWIFQGNPKAFDFEKGFKEDLIDNWTVTTHKDKIKNGDKVIIWITGKNAGCYALAEVTHDPMVIEKSKDDHLWNNEPKESLKVGIKITHNLIEKPILKKTIVDLKEFLNLKVGNQGTNFTLKENEYLKFLELAVPMNQKKYWLYAPGEGAKKWDDFYNEGIMGLGWLELGDLNQYKTKKEISDRLKELDDKGSSKTNDTNTNYSFKEIISIGDIIISKKGTSEYLGYGVVESDYYYDDSREYYKKCRKVEWKKKGIWEEDGKIVLKTLTDITKYPDYVEKLIKLIGIEDSNRNKINLSLNTIIYGPPGTGKTYRLKNEFFEKFTDEQSTQTKEDFCEELIQGISWWQTISVVMLDLKEAKVQEIFEHPLLQAKVRISDNKTPKNTIWGWLQRHTKDDCANVNFKKRDNPQFFNKDNKSTWTIDEEIAKAEAPDFYEVLEKYQKFKPQIESKKRYVFTTFHQSFSYEDFIEGIKPKLMKNEEDLESQDISYHIENGIFKNIANKAINDPNKDYAIFIDEINRGNIANIFGELITLIEEDKRKGCNNYIPAILPYSKTEFGVPKNLYIIGTMNTADRSVEALDNALRRRFSFLEMNPEPEKLSQEEFACEGIDLEKLLFSINNRIEKLLDKDYCIGHSYFMNISDLKNPIKEIREIFSNRILPLLQEYFYGDWGKIMLVLGKGFIDKKVESVSFLATEDYDDFEDYDEKPVFGLVSSDTWTLETFKKIYE
jgi:AAA domain (dynein-related subfamily)/EVE domain